MGSRRPQAARLVVRVALSLVATEGILVGIALILGRNVWGYCYNQVEEVVRYVGEILLLVAISHFFDGLQSVLSGLQQLFISILCNHSKHLNEFHAFAGATFFFFFFYCAEYLCNTLGLTHL